MQQPPHSSRRQFLGIAGGAAVLGALPVVIVRPAKATPAMLASAIQNVTGGSTAFNASERYGATSRSCRWNRSKTSWRIS